MNNHNKVKKDIWEHLLVYPSFNARFFFILTVILLFFIISGRYLLINENLINSNKIQIINLLIQGATLVGAIFAAYYALRQLVETRLNSLNETALSELKRRHYITAIKKWKEAIYIKPEFATFSSLSEAYLLILDFRSFDNLIKMLDLRPLLSRKFLSELSDRIVIIFLKIVRQLLVKNLGEAEKYIKELIKLKKESSAPLTGIWDFSDLRNSRGYQELTGECKIIAENLIAYLDGNIGVKRLKEFEDGNFASQAIDDNT